MWSKNISVGVIDKNISYDDCWLIKYIIVDSRYLLN